MASMDLAEPAPDGPADGRVGAKQVWCALGAVLALLIDLAGNGRASLLIKLREALNDQHLLRVEDALVLLVSVVAAALFLFAVKPSGGRAGAFARGLATVAILAALLPYRPVPGTTEIRTAADAVTAYRKTVSVVFAGDRAPPSGARLVLRDAASGTAVGETALRDAHSTVGLTAPIGVYDLDIEADGFRRTRARIVVTGASTRPAMVDVAASSVPLAVQHLFAPARAVAG